MQVFFIKSVKTGSPPELRKTDGVLTHDLLSMQKLRVHTVLARCIRSLQALVSAVSSNG